MFAIEKPPELTGDEKKDIENIHEYVSKLVDELEYALRKKGKNEEQN